MKSFVFILVVAIFQLVSCVDRQACCGGGRDINGVIVKDKIFYVERSFKANFFQAFEYCRSIGMRLAVIYSLEEEDALQTYFEEIGLTDPKIFWISGNDLGKNNTYNWMSTGEPFIYTNFRLGQPTHFTNDMKQEEHCIMLELKESDGMGWDDRSCVREYNFICEMKFCNDN